MKTANSRVNLPALHELFEELFEIGAANQFHRDEIAAVGFAQVVGLDDCSCESSPRRVLLSPMKLSMNCFCFA